MSILDDIKANIAAAKNNNNPHDVKPIERQKPSLDALVARDTKAPHKAPAFHHKDDAAHNRRTPDQTPCVTGSSMSGLGR
jgi:hypothetical protein